MYNNVGRSTARGTGTNGYIQRNLAKLDPTRQRTIAALQKPLKQKSFNARKPNKAILERQTERAIESKVYDLQCSLEDKGNNEALIKMKCSELREELRRKVAMGESLGEEKNKDSHMIAALQHEKNEIFRRALNISKEHKRGQGFDQTLQDEKKEQRIQDRLADTEKTVEEKLEELERHPLARKPKHEDDEERGEERRGRGGRNDGGGWGGDRDHPDRGARWVKDRNRSSRNWRRDERRGGDRERDRDRGRRDRRRDSDRRRRGGDRRDAERKQQRTRRRGEKRTLESPSPPRKRLKRTEDKHRQTRSPSNSAEAMPDDGGRWTGVTERKRLSISGERDEEHHVKSKKKEKKKRKFKLRNSKSDKQDADRKRRDPSFDKNLEEHLREQETSKSFKPKLQVVDSAPDPEPSESLKKAKKKRSGKSVKKKSRKKKKVETPPSSDDSDSDSDSSSSS